ASIQDRVPAAAVTEVLAGWHCRALTGQVQSLRSMGGTHQPEAFQRDAGRKLTWRLSGCSLRLPPSRQLQASRSSFFLKRYPVCYWARISPGQELLSGE